MGKPEYIAILCPNKRPHHIRSGGKKDTCGYPLKYFLDPEATFDDVVHCPHCTMFWKVTRSVTGATTAAAIPPIVNFKYKVQPMVVIGDKLIRKRAYA